MKLNLQVSKTISKNNIPGLKFIYDVVMNDNLLKGLDQYIKDNQIDIITLTSYKREIYLHDYLTQVSLVR